MFGLALRLGFITMTQHCLVIYYHCHSCPTDEEPWTGHGADQQPGGAAAEGHRQPQLFPQKNDCAQHPAPAPQLPARQFTGGS